MIKKVVLILIAAAVSVYAQGDIRIFSIGNDPKSDLPKVIEKTLKAGGFTIAANTEMTKPFTIQFKQNDFSVFHLMTAYHTKLAPKLVRKYPDAGIFVPMGFGIYQRKGDKQLHVSVLTAEAQAKIIGLKSVDPILRDIEKAAVDALKKAMPGATVSIDTDNPLPAKGPLLSKYVMQLDDDDYEDAKDELDMTLQSGFKPLGFVQSNSMDFDLVLSDDESVEDPFDFYDSYSICKLKVIYNVAKTRPQAAAFAPCTMMVYKQKGTPKIVLGFPAVYNWMSSARIEDTHAKAELMKAQHDFESLLSDVTQ